MEEQASNAKIDPIPGPEMIRLGKMELPPPPEIQRGNFEDESLVQFSKMSDFPKMQVDLPKMLFLGDKHVTPRYSVSEVARALKLSEAELYISVFRSEQKLRYSLFGRLDKLFHGNRKTGGPQSNNKRHE